MYVSLGQAATEQRQAVIAHQAALTSQINTELARLKKDAEEIQTYLRDPTYQLTTAQKKDYTELLKQIHASMSDLLSRKHVAAGEVKYQQKKMAERHAISARKALAQAYFTKKAQEATLSQRPRGLRAYIQALVARQRRPHV